MADGGTIYLDDVDDISVAQQTKLLRVIEEKSSNVWAARS